ncbi:hypothetical protein ACVWYH_006025 [Bradyrhizobium sp. GM24.11]
MARRQRWLSSLPRLTPGVVSGKRVAAARRPADKPQKKLTWSGIRTLQIAPIGNRRYERRWTQVSTWNPMSLVSLPSRLAVLAMLLALVFFGPARAETSDVETA